jgi:hypothetical protein
VLSFIKGMKEKGSMGQVTRSSGAIIRQDGFSVARRALVTAGLLVSGRADAAGNAGIYIEGPDASEVRDAFAAAVPNGVSVLSEDALSLSLAGGPTGQKISVLKRLEGAGHDAEVRRIRKAAAALGLDVVLVGRVRREGRVRRVRLVVIDRVNGEENLQELAYQPGDTSADADLESRVREALASYADAPAPPAPEPKTPIISPASAPAPQDEGRDAFDRRPWGVVNRSLFQVEVGGSAVGRHFDYNDGLSNNLRSYNVLPAAMFSVGVEVFPLAGASGILRDVGLTGSYARSLFLESSIASGSNTGTVESAYAVGIRVRIHPWGDDGPLIGVSDEYAVQSFVFDSVGSPVDGQVPSVDYQANRAAVDVRVPLGKFALLAGAGFRAVLSGGEVESRFRSPTVQGIDGELGASLTVASGWEMRVVLDYERYFYAFEPAPGDVYVAGGALDQFFGARLALAYIF